MDDYAVRLNCMALQRETAQQRKVVEQTVQDSEFRKIGAEPGDYDIMDLGKAYAKRD